MGEDPIHTFEPWNYLSLDMWLAVLSYYKMLPSSYFVLRDHCFWQPWSIWGFRSLTKSMPIQEMVWRGHEQLRTLVKSWSGWIFHLCYWVFFLWIVMKFVLISTQILACRNWRCTGCCYYFSTLGHQAYETYYYDLVCAMTASLFSVSEIAFLLLSLGVLSVAGWK